MPDNPFYSDEPIYKIILPLSEIPDKATVAKLSTTPTKGQFTVSREIRFYNSYKEGGTFDPAKKVSIKAEEGTVFLINGNGNINVYPETKEVIWFINQYELEDLINPPETPQ